MEQHYRDLWLAWARECGLEEAWELDEQGRCTVIYGDLLISGFLDHCHQVRLFSHLATWEDKADPQSLALLLAFNGRYEGFWPLKAALDENLSSLMLAAWAPVRGLTPESFAKFLDEFASQGQGLVAGLNRLNKSRDGAGEEEAALPSAALRI